MSSALATGDLVNLTFTDWEGAHRAHLDAVSRTATVGQVVSEAVQALGLPFQHLHQAVFRGRELDPADTLEELGVETDSEISLVPEVSAG